MESREDFQAKRPKSHEIQRRNLNAEVQNCRRTLSLVQDNRTPDQKLKALADFLVERAKSYQRYQDRINKSVNHFELVMLRGLQDLDLLAKQAKRLDERFMEKSKRRISTISAKDKEIELLKAAILNQQSEHFELGQSESK